MSVNEAARAQARDFDCVALERHLQG